jgi:hypothetical protein
MPPLPERADASLRALLKMSWIPDELGRVVVVLEEDCVEAEEYE